MPEYRRLFRPGGTYFFTVVTYDRMPILCEPLARRLLHRAMADCQREQPFTLDAIVLLPDHLHAIWTLPEGDQDFPTRWGKIKKGFTEEWLQSGRKQRGISESRLHNRRRGVWQRRFWEHLIRDQNDMNQHLDYIHYNPVKHGLTTCPHAWPYSSFSRWVAANGYTRDWCCTCNGPLFQLPQFGEVNE